MAIYKFPDSEPSLVLPNQSTLVCRLLENRGHDRGSAIDFLTPDYETALHDPMLLNHMPQQ